MIVVFSVLIKIMLLLFFSGGPCSDQMPNWSYHNSFLIADSSQAWILETAGGFPSHWVAERVESGFRNISNSLSITTKIDLHSPQLKEEAVKRHLWDGMGEFNFAKTFSDDYVEGNQICEKNTTLDKTSIKLDICNGRNSLPKHFQDRQTNS
jgi:dipeptidase